MEAFSGQSRWHWPPLLSAPSLGPEQDDFMVQGPSSRQMGPGEQCNVSSYRRAMAWPLVGLQVPA